MSQTRKALGYSAGRSSSLIKPNVPEHDDQHKKQDPCAANRRFAADVRASGTNLSGISSSAGSIFPAPFYILQHF
jgi:hypothetical protein